MFEARLVYVRNPDNYFVRLTEPELVMAFVEAGLPIVQVKTALQKVSEALDRKARTKR